MRSRALRRAREEHTYLERAGGYKEHPELFHAFHLHYLAWLLRCILTAILGTAVFLLYALVDPQDIKIPKPARQIAMAFGLLVVLYAILVLRRLTRRVIEMAHAVQWVSEHGPPELSASEAHPEPDTK